MVNSSLTSFGTSPTIVSPNITGTATAATINAANLTVTAAATASTDVTNKLYVDSSVSGVSYSAGVGVTKSGSTFLIQSSGNTLNPTANNLDLTAVSQTNSTGNTSANIVQGVTVDTYGRVTGVTSGTHTLASTTIAGIASFSDSNFTVTSGAVAAKAITLTAGSGITLSTTTVNLNDSVTITNAGVVSFAGATGAVTVATSNGATVTTTDSQINIGLTQDIRTSASPTFNGLTATTVTATTVNATTVNATTVNATSSVLGVSGVTLGTQKFWATQTGSSTILQAGTFGSTGITATVTLPITSGTLALNDLSNVSNAIINGGGA